MSNNDEKRRGWFWKRPHSKWLLGIPIGAVVAFFLGGIALAGFNTALDMTSKTEFCFACHSLELNIKPEYMASSHAFNAAGVRAECKDCHLPEAWFPYVKKKIIVSLDIIPELQGVISTEEKYEARRGKLKRKVWAHYLENESEYCMHCHQWETMAAEPQSRMATRMHERAQERGQSCIYCHRGLAHDLREGDKEIWREVKAEYEATLSQ